MNRPPRPIMLLYAAFSMLWLALAGYLISHAIYDPLLQNQAYIAKELLLIAVSTGLFYLLLRLGQSPSDALIPKDGAAGRFRLNQLVLIFASLALVAPLVALGIFRGYGPELEQGAYADLQTITDLKIGQIELWLEERRGDAESLRIDKVLAERIVNLPHKRADKHLRQLVRTRLSAVQRAYGYESVLLFAEGTEENETTLALGEQRPLSARARALVPAALQTGQVQSSDMYSDEKGEARLDIVAPLVPDEFSKKAGTVIVLRANLRKFLLPLVEKWPGKSLSAETLLVRQDGETITYLNRRRHAANRGEKERQGYEQPGAEEGLALIAAIRQNQRGTLQGLDYRGEPVFAAHGPIAGTGWHLVSKIDRSEVLAPLWTLIYWVSIVILLATAIVGLVLVLLWRQQQQADRLALLVRTTEQDRLLKNFYEMPFIGMATTSPVTKCWLRCNDQLCEILGYPREELMEKSWVELTHPDDVEKDIAAFENVMRGESEGYALNKRFIRKDKTIVITNTDVKCVRRNDGSVDYFVAMIRDITEQEHRKNEILAAQNQLQATLDAIPDLLFELDLDGACHAYHSARTDLPAIPVESMLGKKISEVLPAVAVEIILSALREAREKGLSAGKQLELDLAQGKLWFELSVSRRHADPGTKPRFIVLARDITERKAAEQRIMNLAHYDPLTGLPNRVLLGDRMKVAIQHAARQSRRLAVLFVDLDRFKPINDSLGHDIGDKLLKAVAVRMQGSVRVVDTVSRVGGDEFVVLLSEIELPDDAARVAEKLILGLSQPYRIDEHELLLTASIGICIYPDNGTQPSILLRNADASMYTAKQGGRNRYQFYSDDMTQRAIERLGLEHDLRGAVERGETFLVYQPQIELATSRIIGMEVLMRWRHATRGLISPARFIPVAEDSGIILTLGEWALHESCQQAQLWRDQGLLDVCVSVNVSAVQLRQTDFVHIVARVLADTGLPPANLELELTESVIMQETESTLEKLRELETLGVKVAIDDFGTGHSSLSYLRQFTVDRLKIDQSFVHDLPGNVDAEAIAGAIVAMGLRLGLRIIAEGVETEAQAAFLQSALCKEGQGYFYARPMTADAFQAWVATWKQAQPIPDQAGEPESRSPES
ncbi:MAG: diguanylate cyclase/phosphodiesterase (GGDEF & EAL domains) with PAS/PAC sensor(s) [Nitrosospira sp.]